MNRTISQLVEWLRQHDHVLRANDEPYERFLAELQDLSRMLPGHARLSLGYWFEQDGDLVPDPHLVLELRSGQIIGGTIRNAMGSFPIETDPHYVAEIIDLMWERHFLPRLAESLG